MHIISRFWSRVCSNCQFNAALTSLPFYTSQPLGKNNCISLYQQAALRHDDRTHQTFPGTYYLSPASWQQVLLPVKDDGFGIASLKKVLPAAFIAGWAHTVQVLPDMFPGSSCLTSHLLDTSSTGRFAHNLDETAVLVYLRLIHGIFSI